MNFNVEVRPIVLATLGIVPNSCGSWAAQLEPDICNQERHLKNLIRRDLHAAREASLKADSPKLMRSVFWHFKSLVRVCETLLKVERMVRPS